MKQKHNKKSVFPQVAALLTCYGRLQKQEVKLQNDLY